MKQRVLVSSIIMGLYAGLTVGNAMAQSAAQTPDQDQSKKRETTELKGVVVTGSLIPRARIETASPTVTITAADIQKQAFATVYDALKALPIANGGVQGNQSSGGFTQGAAIMTCFALLSILAMFLGRETKEDPLPLFEVAPAKD